MSSVFGRGGGPEGWSAAERWVYESHNQAPLLDNPGGVYEQMCVCVYVCTRVCNRYVPGQTMFIRAEEVLCRRRC